MEVHKARKNNPEAPLTERERSQLRGICGAGQWIGTQTAPWVLARVSHLQGRVPTATVSDIAEANKIVRDIREHCNTPIIFRKLNDPVFIAWHDAAWASWVDQHSQGGGFILAAAEKCILEGERSACNIISWGSKRLPRVPRSSASAEVQAISEAMEELEYVRYAWGEIELGTAMALSQPLQTIKHSAGATVSDCKVLYDSLNGNSSAG